MGGYNVVASPHVRIEPAPLKITPLIYIHERLPIRTRALWAAFRRRTEQVTYFATFFLPSLGWLREPRGPLALLAALSAAVFQHVRVPPRL